MPRYDEDVSKGQVVPFSTFTRSHTDAAINKIEQYWEKVRRKRVVPSRCDIDPRGLEGVLSHAFILERVSGGLARFRISGSHLNELTGLELRRMPISALFTPASRDAVTCALESVFDEPSMVRLTLRSPGGFGRTELKGHMTLLPLRSDLGDISRVLGGVSFEGRIGRTPRRLEIVEQSRKTLIGYSGEVADPFAAMPAQPEISRPLPAAPQKRPLRSERPHLRIVVSNE